MRRSSKLVKFVENFRCLFRRCQLVATESTGIQIRRELGLVVETVPLGGDLIVGAMVVRQEISAIFFFRDPMTSQPHEPVCVCDVHSVPLATNAATAECVAISLLAKLDCAPPKFHFGMTHAPPLRGDLFGHNQRPVVERLQ